MRGNINKILIDTSFITKILGLDTTNPDIQKKSISLIQNKKLAAPYLIVYELGNTLLKYKSINSKKIWKIFNNLNLEFYFSDDKNKISSLAKKYRLTYYDAAYLTILLKNKSIKQFYTFDRDFQKIKNKKIKVFNLSKFTKITS
jgi:predicted nucleic acid-binding protein